MANRGDSYIVSLRNTHLDWGEYRYTGSRKPIPGEAYIPIPNEFAKRFNLLNTNGTDGKDVLGKNIFRYKTADGRQSGVLRAQGNSERGDIYAKQFSADKDLKKLGTWLRDIGASVGTEIKVEWISPYDIVLSEA